MPGTPATSPRFGIARYADADTASFSAQVNAITDGFDSNVARRLVPNILGSSGFVTDHQVVVAAPNTIVTLPTPSSEHELVCVYANEFVGSVLPVTVQRAGSTAVIRGRGLAQAGVTSFLLGSPNAFAWLYSDDGTNWRIVEGEQDTGWVAITLGSNIAAVGSAYTPAARVRGDRVELCGVIVNNTGGTVAFGTQIATLPTAAEPAATLWDLPVSLSTGSAMGIEISGNAIKVNAPWSNGVGLGLDNVVYRLV